MTYNYKEIVGREINIGDNPLCQRITHPIIPRSYLSSQNLNQINNNSRLNHHHHFGNNNMEENTQVLVSTRWNPTTEQLTALEELYRCGTRTPSAEQIQHITEQLRRYGKIEGKNVFYWFQNHKARERQKRRRQLHIPLTINSHANHHLRDFENDKGAKASKIGFNEDDENSYKRTPFINNKVSDPSVESEANPRKEDTTLPTVDTTFQYKYNHKNNTLDNKHLFLFDQTLVPCPRHINIVQPSSNSSFELLSLSNRHSDVIIDDNNSNNNGESATDLTLRLFPIWEPSHEDDENDQVKIKEIGISCLETNNDEKIMSCMDLHHDFVPYYEFL